MLNLEWLFTILNRPNMLKQSNHIKTFYNLYSENKIGRNQILSFILFNYFIDMLLKRLKGGGIGVQMGDSID